MSLLFLLARRWGYRGIVVSLLILVLPGCVSNNPPAPRSQAVQRAEAAEEAARRHSQNGHWSAAAAAWRQAADRYALLNARSREAAAWHNLAIAQKHLRDLDAASEASRKAAALNKSLDREQEWWRNQIALLQINALRPSPQDLDLQFTQLIPRTTAIKDPATHGLFLNEWGLWLWRQGDYDAAHAKFDLAMARFQEAEHAPGKASVLANQALVLESEKRFAEAGDTWQTALRQFESLGDPRGIATSMAGLGRSTLAADPSSKHALDLLHRAARNFQLLDLSEQQAQVEALLQAHSQE